MTCGTLDASLVIPLTPLASETMRGSQPPVAIEGVRVTHGIRPAYAAFPEHGDTDVATPLALQHGGYVGATALGRERPKVGEAPVDPHGGRRQVGEDGP